jgi:hypothetical protein
LKVNNTAHDAEQQRRDEGRRPERRIERRQGELGQALRAVRYFLDDAAFRDDGF